MKKIIYIFLMTLVSCAINRQGVYYKEMAAKPIVELNGNILTIKASNSTWNSAPLNVYKVKVSTDQTKKEIYLSAYQAIGKRHKDIFTFKLKKYKITDPNTYSYFWVDPDKKKNKLDISSEK